MLRKPLYMIGDIIEFKNPKDPEDSYVDIISEVILDDDKKGSNTVCYFGRLYEDGQIDEELVIRCIEKRGPAFPELPKPKYEHGQKVSYEGNKGMEVGAVQAIDYYVSERLGIRIMYRLPPKTFDEALHEDSLTSAVA